MLCDVSVSAGCRGYCTQRKNWPGTRFSKAPETFRARNGIFKALVNEDTLLTMMFLGLRKLGNICCGHKMFLNKIRNLFCVPD